jgi:hypothetical protein
MSMEIEVFSDRSLASTAEWQRAIDIEEFPLRLDADVALDEVKGLFPVKLGDTRIGFECFHDDANEIMNDLGAEKFNHRWRFALGFRWLGSRMDELQATWMAAAAYAAATDGVVFDCENGEILTAQQARHAVREIIRDLPRMTALLENIKQEFSKKP